MVSNMKLIMFVLMVILLVVISICIFKNGTLYKSKHTIDCAVSDGKYLYIATHGHLEKWTLGGKRQASVRLPVKHIVNGKVIGNLVVLVSNVPSNSLILVNKDSFQIIDIIMIPEITNPLVWVDYDQDKWWLCDYTGKLKESVIYCFSSEWNPLGVWTLPKEITHNNDGDIVDGIWTNHHLHVGIGSKMYILKLPADKMEAKVLSVVNILLDCTNYSITKDGNVMCVQDTKVCACNL